MTRRKLLSTILPFLLLFILKPAVVLSLEVPPLTGRVNDYANLLSAGTKNSLEQQLLSLEATDSTQIVILTIPSLEGENLEEFSLKAAETWGVGQRGADNGALLLVAVKERKLRIEVGYGLEGSLTDMTSGRIIRNTILPQFKKGSFDAGITLGVQAMIAAVNGEYTAENVESSSSESDTVTSLIGFLLFVFFVLTNMFRMKYLPSAIVCGIAAPIVGMIVVGYSLPLVLGLIPVGIICGLIMAKLHVLNSGKKRSGWSGGWSNGGHSSSGGGFSGGFSGGGGGFGGGGASGGW